MMMRIKSLSFLNEAATLVYYQKRLFYIQVVGEVNSCFKNLFMSVIDWTVHYDLISLLSLGFQQ